MRKLLCGQIEAHRYRSQSPKSQTELVKLYFNLCNTFIHRSNYQNSCSSKADLLFWFFGDFRYGVSLFIVILVIYKYRNR